MKYVGKLYAKVGGKYIPMDYTSADWDELENDREARAKHIIDLRDELEKMKQSRDSWEEMQQTAMAEWRKCVDEIVQLKHNNNAQSERLKMYQCAQDEIDQYTEEIESLQKERLYFNSEFDKLKQALEAIANTSGEKWLQPFEMRDIANKVLNLTK